MRTVRVLLVVLGTATTAYGGWLVWPHLSTTALWLVAGPVLHDAVVAPLVGLAGLALARLLPARAVRWWVAAGLAVTATVLLLAVPLVWRPHPASPNPGLLDRDYTAGLARWLGALWAGVLLAAVIARRRHAARALTEQQHAVPAAGRRGIRGVRGQRQRDPGRTVE